MTYHVTTETRSYNHIESLEHLIRVRRNWNDWSPTIEVFEFVPNQGWVRINQEDMNES